jgi:hypothetical protein
MGVKNICFSQKNEIFNWILIFFFKIFLGSSKGARNFIKSE